MNKNKLLSYHLTGSIHTISVKSQGIVEDIAREVDKCIVSSSQNRNDKFTTTSIINANKLMGDIFSYSEFDVALETILSGAGIDKYDLIRADMRFDSYDREHYRSYAKLNRLLISLLAVTYQVKNCYRSTNLFTQQQLSIAIKNDYFEIENYDKFEESNGTDIAMSRLEERSKKMQDKDLKKEFIEGWSTRWKKAINNFKLVQATYNDALEKLYLENKNAYPKKFRSLTDFCIQYQDCIFSKAQMIDLLSRFKDDEVKDPVIRAENHKKRYGIEYFSKKDIEYAIGEIKRATVTFFDM